MTDPLFIPFAADIKIANLDDYWGYLLAYRRRGVFIDKACYDQVPVKTRVHEMARVILTVKARPLLNISVIQEWPPHLFSEYVHQAFLAGFREELISYISLAKERATFFDVGLLQRLGSYGSFVQEADDAWSTTELSHQMPKSVVIDYRLRAFRSPYVSVIRQNTQPFRSEELAHFDAMEGVLSVNDLNFFRVFSLKRMARMCPLQAEELHRDFQDTKSQALASYARRYSSGFAALQLKHFRKKLLGVA